MTLRSIHIDARVHQGDSITCLLPPPVTEIEQVRCVKVYQERVNEEHQKISTCNSPHIVLKEFRDHNDEEFRQEREAYRLFEGGRNERSTANEKLLSAPKTGPCGETAVIT